ncbi:MAG: hypothetical protein JWN99_629 [Ilumatobacteraceae bacterium]|nr:hypothetical protein [Ilumatobacteraceae bacterium]
MTDGAEIELADRCPTVVCAVSLKQKARDDLAEMLGDVRLVDIREPVATADVVLVPPCSPGTLTALKDAYPTARLIVVELEDWEHHIDLGGPVTRLRKAGADAYLTADSLQDLADQLTTSEPSEQRPLLDSSTPSELEAATIDDVVLGRLQELRERREAEIGVEIESRTTDQ